MERQDPHKMMHMSRGRFAAMIATSTIIMFFLMYQLVYSLGHTTLSITRIVSALVMGCVMAVAMLAFMWSMYEGRTTKAVVFVGAAVLGIVLLLVNRNPGRRYPAQWRTRQRPPSCHPGRGHA